MQSRRAFACLMAVLSGACINGCRKAKIDAPTVPLEPVVSVGTLPESKPSSKEHAWYQGLMPTAVAETRSEDKDKKDKKEKKESPKDRPWAPIDTPTEPPRPNGPAEKEPPAPPTTAASARADAQTLMDELREKIEAARKGTVAWNLLRLDLHSTGSEKGRTLALLADVGLTSLYATRPEILFEQLRFEDCMNRLARMAGMRYAQEDRWGNPLVTWRGENLSVYEAVQAITAQHGFSARFAAAGTRFTFPLEKYATRERFMEEVTRAVKDHGEQMERGMPTLLISLATKASKAEGETKGDKKTAEEPTKKGTKDVK